MDDRPTHQSPELNFLQSQLDSTMAKDEEKSHFELPSENQSFSSRKKDVFAGLDNLEKTHEKKQRDWEDSADGRREQTKLWKDEPEIVDSLVTKDKSFKRPFNSQYRRRGNHSRYQKSTPDYVVNPKKWTRYSLEDCDLSESSNTSAAFAFLEERRKLREAEAGLDEPPMEGSKIVFKKPTKHARASESSNKTVSKRTKVDEVNIQHLDSESTGNTDDPAISSSKSSEQELHEMIEDSTKVKFKKSGKKRNIRVRETNGEGT